MIYYITRSYSPPVTGGTIIRKAQVDQLICHDYDVRIVTPNYATAEIVNNADFIKHPISKVALRLGSYLEKYGLYDDYLDQWVKKTSSHLLDKITPDDIVISTSGGELGCIKLGSIIKEKSKCKLIVNLHDPLDYSLVNARVLDNKYHVSREKQEKQYLQNADLIITSSQLNQKSLQTKYPELAGRIVNNYFGYVEQIKIKEKISSGKIRIAYGGVFLPEQSPHILAEAASQYDDIELIFIGNWEHYKPLKPYLDHCRCIPPLGHAEYLRFMMENVDVGFVSLTSDYLGACVPSKLYEYINLGLPILGALPEGDAKDIINKSGYGIAVPYDDLSALRDAILAMKNPNAFQQYSTAVMRDRDSWAMEHRIKEVVTWLNDL